MPCEVVPKDFPPIHSLDSRGPSCNIGREYVAELEARRKTRLGLLLKVAVLKRLALTIRRGGCTFRARTTDPFRENLGIRQRVNRAHHVVREHAQKPNIGVGHDHRVSGIGFESYRCDIPWRCGLVDLADCSHRGRRYSHHCARGRDDLLA